MTTANTTTTKTAELTKAQARKLTDKIIANLDALPQLIHEAMQGRAYKALGYATIADWADAEFGLSRSRIYQISSWQAVEQKLRTDFHLAHDWTVPEEKVRHMSKTRMNALVASIEEAIANDEERSKDAEGRGDIVRHCVTISYGLLMEKRKKAAQEAKKASQDGDASEGDENKTQTPAVPVRIASVPQDREVLLMKAVDTASVLASLADENEDAELTLAKLTDAREVIENLIAHYEATAA